MKALTVQQPWAWAIVHGGKDVENRTQTWSYRGPLAIHAGLRWSTLERRGNGVWVHLTTAMREADLPMPWARAAFTFGAILGVVDLVDVHRSRPRRYPMSGPPVEACCESPWAEARLGQPGDVVHLVLENPRPLQVPVPCRGALGLWTVPSGVVDQVLAQLEAAAR